MHSDDLTKIIIDKKDSLKILGYNTSDQNIENLVNGFIKIANSMMTENMNKIPNVKIIDILYNSDDLKSSLNLGIKTYELWGKSLEKIGVDIIKYDIINKDNHLNKYKHFLHHLDYKIIDEKTGKPSFIEKIQKEKLKIKNEILKDKEIINNYNKGLLTKEEEQIISKLLTL